MRLENNLYYVMLDCLPDWAKDMKAMLIQAEHPEVRSAAELLDRLPAVAPCTHDWLFPVQDKPGTFMYDGDYFLSLKQIQWDCLWSFIDPTGSVQLPAKKAKTANKTKTVTPWDVPEVKKVETSWVVLEEC